MHIIKKEPIDRFFFLWYNGDKKKVTTNTMRLYLIITFIFLALGFGYDIKPLMVVGILGLILFGISFLI